MAPIDRPRIKARGGWIWAWLIIGSLLLTSCWYKPPSGPAAYAGLGDGVGAVALVASMTSFPSVARELRIVLQHEGLVAEHALPIEEGVAEGVLEGIYEGRWHMILEVWDEEGILTHQGRTDVVIIADEATDLNITLDPLPGTLMVTADLSGFRDAAAVQRARLNVSPGGSRLELVRTGDEAVLEWQRDLAPGTYDFQVALYGDSFHAHNMVYAGPWFSADLRPGRVTELHWEPATGEVRIIGIIGGLPSAPADVTARRDGDEVIIEWVNTSPHASEAAIWWTYDPFLPPIEIARVPTLPAFPDSTVADRFYHRPADDGVVPGSTLVYAVTAVDAEGRHSLRTSAAPLYWDGETHGTARRIRSREYHAVRATANRARRQP